MNGKFGIKVLCLSTLTILALGAGAQAQFLVLNPGVAFTSEGLGENLEEGTPLTLTGQQEGASRFVVPGRSIAIGCVNFHVQEGKLYGAVGHLKLLFLECTVWNIKTEGEHKYVLGAQTPCHIIEGQFSASAKTKVFSHEGKVFVVAEPLTEGQPFKVIKFKSGTGCPLPLTTEVKGVIGAAISQSQLQEQLLTLAPGTQLLLKTKVLYGAFETFIEGAATIKITGPAKFAETAWGVH